MSRPNPRVDFRRHFAGDVPLLGRHRGSPHFCFHLGEWWRTFGAHAVESENVESKGRLDYFRYFVRNGLERPQGRVGNRSPVQNHPATFHGDRRGQYGEAQHLRCVVQCARVVLLGGEQIHRIRATLHHVEVLAGQFDRDENVTRVDAVARQAFPADDVEPKRRLDGLRHLAVA